jgi:hypothetical protein
MCRDQPHLHFCIYDSTPATGSAWFQQSRSQSRFLFLTIAQGRRMFSSENPDKGNTGCIPDYGPVSDPACHYGISDFKFEIADL